MISSRLQTGSDTQAHSHAGSRLRCISMTASNESRKIEPEDGPPTEDEELKKPVERPAEDDDADPELGKGE